MICSPSTPFILETWVQEMRHCERCGGAPEEKQIEWARHPQLMRQMKAQSSRQLAAMQDPRTTLTRPHGFAIPPVSQMNSAKAPKK